MKTNPDIATLTARFDEAARSFEPVCKARYAKLLPFRDGITQLREKGASYHLIRELLMQAGLSVAVDTVGNFVREVIEQREHPRSRPQSKPPRAHSAPSAGTKRLPFTVAPEADGSGAKPTPK